MPTFNVILNGARGGQGTSTIAAAVALFAAGYARTQLVATDLSGTAALLGLREPGEDEIAVTDRLTLTNTATGEPEIRIVDGGTRVSVSGGEDRLEVVVLRGPCYVALRSLVCSGYRQPDGIVLLSEPGRSLTDRDVHDVTGIPVVATVAVTPAVARTIDAGLLIGRLHRLRDLAPLRRYTAGLLNFPPRRDPTSGLLTPALPPAADLNESPFRTPVKIGTDLPVPLKRNRAELRNGQP